MSARKFPDGPGLLSFLWERFDSATATDDELKLLSGATDEAEAMSRIIAETLYKAGSFVAEESDAGRSVTRLNGVDVSTFLGEMSRAVETIAELTMIGGEASFFIAERAKAKPASKRACTTEDSSKAET
jgi:hypothetical protein